MKPLSERQKLRLRTQLSLLDGLSATARVLDVGTEYGHTGRSLREEFPFAFIEGVEVHKETFDKCVELSAGATYNRLHHQDALDFFRGTQDSWDAIICAELIEHLSKEKARELVAWMKAHSDLVIVTSPIGFMRQGAMYGNPHQVHVSGWMQEEVEALGFETHLLDRSLSLGVYVYQD